MPNKIIITGASGYIGRQLVPRLLSDGYQLHLVSRDARTLSHLSSDRVSVSNYTGLDATEAYDAIVHLAARNNDQPGTREDFLTDNVGLAKALVSFATQLKIPQIVHLSTLHAHPFYGEKKSPYAQSKAAAEAVFDDAAGVSVHHLRLAAVYGVENKGRLAILNRVPTFLKGSVLNILKCVKPAVSAHNVVDRIAGCLQERVQSIPRTEILADDQSANPVYTWSSRIIDLIIAGSILVLLFWLLLIVWAVVKLESSGPCIFAQKRVGRNQRPFVLYKFRTMDAGTPQTGTHEASVSAVTRTWNFLRKTKIDELPQAINVLLNQMSFVGPRPCLFNQTELVSERAARQVFSIKGGITGLAQIQNIDMSTPQALAIVDRDYIALRTVLLDVKLLIMTALGKGQGDKIKPT